MEGKSVEMWIKKEEEKGKGKRKIDLFTVGFGDHKIKAAYTYDDLTVSDWIDEVMRMHKKKCLSAHTDSIAGISVFSGQSFTKKRYNDDWISIVSICVFGTHCLLLPIDDNGRFPFRSSVQSFLGNSHVHLVRPEVGKIAEKMNRDWNLSVKNPVKLRPLVEAAFEKKQVVARSRTTGLEELAHAALGIIVKKKPKIQYNPWRRKPEDVEAEVMHATVDAFLAYRIGMKSFQVTQRRRDPTN